MLFGFMPVHSLLDPQLNFPVPRFELELVPDLLHRFLPSIGTTFCWGSIIRWTCWASASNALTFSSKYSCRSYTPRTPPITWPRHRSAWSLATPALESSDLAVRRKSWITHPLTPLISSIARLWRV